MKSSLLVLLLMFILPASANQKHPRVAELEDKYKTDAIRFLGGRFPGLPFSVTVSIDPLRNTQGPNYQIQGETLPFYALDEEAIVDIWDDPTATLYTLSRRIKKVEVDIQIPESVGDEEVVEIKATISDILRLIPARDEIEITKRDWNVLPYLWTYIGVGLFALLTFLVGLFLISRVTIKNMTASIEKIQAQTATPSAAPVTTGTSKMDHSKSSSSGPSGDIKLNDPIKIREVIETRVQNMVEQKDFLTLENYIKLDKLGREDSEALGAFVSLFPKSLQLDLFGYGAGTHWLDAYTYPGQLSMQCLQISSELSRVKTAEFEKHWESLLIQVWRMEDKAVPFLREMESTQAMAILNHLPKFKSVPLARNAFPGSWASILDLNSKSEALSESESKKLYDKSLKTAPLLKFDVLNVYKKERELLSYLHIADFQSEKEIYEVAPKDSILKQLRPPFYEVFEEQEHDLKPFIESVSIDDWSLALFNVPREERRKLESYFNSKEKYFYLERLKNYDRSRPDMRDVGSLREQIAQDYQNFINTSQENKNIDELHAQESHGEDSEAA